MGATAANFVNIVALMLCAAWMGVALYPGHWHYEDVALFYKFNVGLYSVHVEKSVGSGLADMGLSLVTKKLGVGEKFEAVKAAVAESIEGHHYIAKTSETFCSIPIPGLGKDLCNTWKTVQYSGWATLLCIGLCVLFLLLGVGFNYFFWNSKVTEMGARWTLIFFWLAPICALIGIGQYGVFTNEFSMNLISSSSAGTWDFSFFFASFLVGVSMIPALVTGLCSEMNVYVGYKVQGKEAMYGSLEEAGGQPALGSHSTAWQQQGGGGAPQYGSTMPPPPGGAAYGGGALPASGAPFFAGQPPQAGAFVAAGAAGGDKFVVVQAPAPAPGTGQAAW